MPTRQPMSSGAIETMGAIAYQVDCPNYDYGDLCGTCALGATGSVQDSEGYPSIARIFVIVVRDES